MVRTEAPAIGESRRTTATPQDLKPKATAPVVDSTAGAGRQMGDGYNQAGFVGKALEFTFPETDAGAVAAAAIGRYGQGSSLGIASAAKPLPPAANALDRKFGGIGIDPDIHPSLVGGNVIDAVRR